MIPEPIKKFTEYFSKLPSVGPRMATRLGFFLVSMENKQLEEIAEALSSLKDLNNCPKCFFIKSSNDSFCHICSNNNRDKEIVLIIEKETDLLSIEKSNSFQGTYLILGEIDNRGQLKESQKQRLSTIKGRAKKVKDGKLKEIIIALSPNSQGDLASQIIKNSLEEFAEKITKIGRGIPTGGEIEFADEDTLLNALESRK